MKQCTEYCLEIRMTLNIKEEVGVCKSLLKTYLLINFYVLLEYFGGVNE